MHQRPLYGKQRPGVPGRPPPAPGPRDRHARRPRRFGAGDAALAAAWPSAIDAPGPLTDLSVAASNRHP